MDKVTQQNAANAEESASAAEELSAQAETMQGMVDELVAMVGGAGKAKNRTSAAAIMRSKASSRTKRLPPRSISSSQRPPQLRNQRSLCRRR